MSKALWSDKRKFIWVLTLVLLSAFFLTSWSSYQVARHSLTEQIESNTLPLTSDNIYSEIQQDLLRPIFISSLMAHDTFVRDWALQDAKDPAPMVRYLKELQERFGTVTSFYVSEKTGRYYHSTGVLKTVSDKDPKDEWYFRVRDLPAGEDFEINIDTDTADRSKTTVFLITTMIQPFRTTLKWFCSGGLNHGQKQGSISKKHEHSYLYSALWR